MAVTEPFNVAPVEETLEAADVVTEGELAGINERTFPYVVPAEFTPFIWKKYSLNPIDFGVGIKLKVYLDSWVVGDECGYQQAHGDIIQKHGIIADDMWIHWLDLDSHMIHYDKENPRIEIVIYRYKHLYEDYCDDKEKKEAAKEERKKLKQLKNTGS